MLTSSAVRKVWQPGMAIDWDTELERELEECLGTSVGEDEDFFSLGAVPAKVRNQARIDRAGVLENFIKEKHKSFEDALKSNNITKAQSEFKDASDAFEELNQMPRSYTTKARSVPMVIETIITNTTSTLEIIRKAMDKAMAASTSTVTAPSAPGPPAPGPPAPAPASTSTVTDPPVPAPASTSTVTDPPAPAPADTSTSTPPADPATDTTTGGGDTSVVLRPLSPPPSPPEYDVIFKNWQDNVLASISKNIDDAPPGLNFEDLEEKITQVQSSVDNLQTPGKALSDLLQGHTFDRIFAMREEFKAYQAQFDPLQLSKGGILHGTVDSIQRKIVLLAPRDHEGKFPIQNLITSLNDLGTDLEIAISNLSDVTKVISTALNDVKTERNKVFDHCQTRTHHVRGLTYGALCNQTILYLTILLLNEKDTTSREKIETHLRSALEDYANLTARIDNSTAEVNAELTKILEADALVITRGHEATGDVFRHIHLAESTVRNLQIMKQYLDNCLSRLILEKNTIDGMSDVEKKEKNESERDFARMRLQSVDKLLEKFKEYWIAALDSTGSSGNASTLYEDAQKLLPYAILDVSPSRFDMDAYLYPKSGETRSDEETRALSDLVNLKFQFVRTFYTLIHEDPGSITDPLKQYLESTMRVLILQIFSEDPKFECVETLYAIEKNNQSKIHNLFQKISEIDLSSPSEDSLNEVYLLSEVAVRSCYPARNAIHECTRQNIAETELEKLHPYKTLYQIITKVNDFILTQHTYILRCNAIISDPRSSVDDKNRAEQMSNALRIWNAYCLHIFKTIIEYNSIQYLQASIKDRLFTTKLESKIFWRNAQLESATSSLNIFQDSLNEAMSLALPRMDIPDLLYSPLHDVMRNNVQTSISKISKLKTKIDTLTENSSLNAPLFIFMEETYNFWITNWFFKDHSDLLTLKSTCMDDIKHCLFNAEKKSFISPEKTTKSDINLAFSKALDNDASSQLKSAKSEIERLQSDYAPIEKNSEEAKKFVDSKNSPATATANPAPTGGGSSTTSTTPGPGPTAAGTTPTAAAISAADLVKLRDDLKKAQDGLTAAQTEVGQLKTQLDEEKAKVKDGETKLTAAEAKVNDLTPQLTAAEAKVNDLTSKLTAAEVKVNDLEPKLTEANGKLAKADEDKKNAVEAAKKSVTDARDAADAAAAVAAAAAAAASTAAGSGGGAAVVSATPTMTLVGEFDDHSTALETALNVITATDVSAGFTPEPGLTSCSDALDVCESELNINVPVQLKTRKELYVTYIRRLSDECKEHLKKEEKLGEDLATSQASLATSQRDLATSQASLATSQRDLATSQASLATSQASLATSQGNLNSALLYIPTIQRWGRDMQAIALRQYNASKKVSEFYGNFYELVPPSEDADLPSMPAKT